MASIIEGQQYGLSSQFNNGKGQSMVFVKLTDSALKAIEDYAAAVSKGNASPSFRPSIEFRPNNSQGVITIPTKVSNTDSEKHSYNFSVKDIQNDGILECIQQNKKMSMESLGKIMLRMQIHANDDSYQTTKVKMAVAAEQELKKYNTQVIQSSDPNVGRKVKVKRPFNSKPFVPLSNNTSNTSSMYKQSNPIPMSSMPRFSKFPNQSSLPKQSFNGFHSNVLSGKTVRENLVHLLAVRPMKLSDLLSKLQEKLKEPIDKNNSVFTNVLNSVSTTKDEIYYLKESLWDEVQLDWTHFSKEERNLVQKHNPLMATVNLSESAAPNVKLASSNLAGNNTNSNGNSISPLSDGSARSQSSPNSVSTSPNLKTSPYNKANNLKRNSESMYLNNLKRLKSDNSRLTVQNNGKTHSGANSSAIVSHLSPFDKLNNVSDQESPEARNIFTSNSNCYKSSISLIPEGSNLVNKKSDISMDRETYNSRVNSYQRISGNGSGSINSTPNSSPDSGISHIGNVPSSDSSINNDSDDYLSKYNKIQSNEQLSQYRNDFCVEYPEYRRLYDYVESVSRQFEELHELILTKDEESEEWHELIKQTIEKYNEVKHKSRYNKAQKRLNYLHYKLLHIKNLISDYTRNQEKGISPLPRFSSSQLKS